MSGFSPLQQGCLDAYAAASALIPVHLRPAFILIGGAATISHGALQRRTEDVDIAASPEAIGHLWEVAGKRQGGFSLCDSDGSITWDTGAYGGKSWLVTIELLEMPGPFVPFIPSVCEFRSGYVATLPELVGLRASALVGRGDQTDYDDFELLLRTTARRCLELPEVEREELKVLKEAVKISGSIGEGREKDYRLSSVFMAIVSGAMLDRCGIIRV